MKLKQKLKTILTFELGLNESMTGFTAPPSTIRTISLIRIVTTHFKCDKSNFIISQVEHTWTSEQVQNVCNVLNLKIPNTSTIEDVTYTANMAYADFYPELLNEHQCIKYAAAVANDKDGYTGIQFCRWVADVVGKKENIDWDKFK